MKSSKEIMKKIGELQDEIAKTDCPIKKRLIQGTVDTLFWCAYDSFSDSWIDSDIDHFFIMMEVKADEI